MCFQAKESKRFTVTRYLHRDCVGNVYYGPGRNAEDEQPIELFHVTIADRLLIWIDDPIISVRTCARNYEINRMLVNALGFPSLLQRASLLPHRHDEFTAFNDSLKMVLTLQKDKADQYRAFLTRLFSLNVALLMKKITALRGTNPNALDTGLSSDADKRMLVTYVDILELVQQQRFAAFAQKKDNAVATPVADDIIDLAEMQGILNELLAANTQYTIDVMVDRKDHWENEESNQLVAMRANLSEYFVEPDGVSAADKAICQRSIDNAERDLKMVQHSKEENFVQIDMQIQQIERGIRSIVSDMTQTLNALNATAQQFWADDWGR